MTRKLILTEYDDGRIFVNDGAIIGINGKEPIATHIIHDEKVKEDIRKNMFDKTKLKKHIKELKEK